MMNRNVMWLGPISVLGFVVVLAVMYGWVGSVNSVGYEVRERARNHTNRSAESHLTGRTRPIRQEIRLIRTYNLNRAGVSPTMANSRPA